MTEERKFKGGGASAGAAGGVIWFIGWLFTIGYVNLVWWKIILGNPPSWGRILKIKEANMAEEKKSKGGGASAGAAGGVIWFIGWLFTIGYVNLVWWKILLGIVIWPYYLGVDIR